MVTEALFPGYLFARFRFAADHRNVRYAHGVSRILQFGEHLACLPDEVIAALRAQVGVQPVFEVVPELSVGMPVTIVHGAFRGLPARITQLRSTERVRVLLEFLGREMEAEIGTTHLLAERSHPLAAAVSPRSS